LFRVAFFIVQNGGALMIDLIKLYGTDENLQENCRYCKECWKGYEEQKIKSYVQKPYYPYIGDSYKGILFSGINLNGGNDEIDCIHSLVKEAKKYISNGKKRIFKSATYGGSEFYYHIPIIANMYTVLLESPELDNNVSDLSPENIAQGFQYLALTNLIKCSTEINRSTPTPAMYENCLKIFVSEISNIHYKVLILFTLHKYIRIEKYFNDFKKISDDGGYRLWSNGEKYILEYGHPVSTSLTSEEKFEYYFTGIKNLIEKINTQNANTAEA